MNIKTSAPGKVILLGEHSVVYGKPAIAIAIDKRITTTISDSNTLTLNGYGMDMDGHPHLRHILSEHNNPILSITVDSELPTSSGLGSSAALSSSLVCALRKMEGKGFDMMAIAKESFETEYVAQGRASPVDTYTSSIGNGIVLNGPEGIGKRIAKVEKNGNVWDIQGVDIPEMTLVVGNTGIKSNTGPIVDRVRRYRESNGFAKEIIDEIGIVTEEGINAIKKNDAVALGEFMLRDHKLLSILGVSCNELNKLVMASVEHSYGAKLTGSGGGGSMIALTDNPDKVSEAIRLHGGTPFIVRTSTVGVKEE